MTRLRIRRWLARKLDPAIYEVAREMHRCLNGLTAELYESRYEGLGTPGGCCYQAVYDYQATEQAR